MVGGQLHRPVPPEELVAGEQAEHALEKGLVQGGVLEGEVKFQRLGVQLLPEARVGEDQISDVEVGAFLSGGVDSSFIAALSRPDKTYSVGFDRKGFNEAGEAQELCKELAATGGGPDTAFWSGRRPPSPGRKRAR